MIRRRSSGAAKASGGRHREETTLVKEWASAMVRSSFLRTRSLREGLAYMLDKPVGYHAFMRLDDGKFTLLLREEEHTARYTVVPDENYSAYLLSCTLQGQRGIPFAHVDELVERCKADASQFVEDRSAYDMIRRFEMHEAQSLAGLRKV